MSSTNPFAIATKEVETASITTVGAVGVGLAVGFNSAQASTAGQVVRGLAKVEATAAGEVIAIVTEGTAVARAGATISSIGAALMTNNAGRLVPATSTNSIFARSLDTAASGEYFEVQITREGVSA